MQQKKRGNLRTKNHLNNSNNNEKWPPFFILFCRSFDFFMNAHKIWTQCEWFSFNFNLPRILICVSSTFSPPFALYYTYSKLLMSSGIVVFFLYFRCNLMIVDWFFWCVNTILCLVGYVIFVQLECIPHSMPLATYVSTHDKLFAN